MSNAPAVLGKYQLVRKLAAGGMAEVFLARAAGPMGFEKTVVVKRILPHLADEQNFISMFLSEARLAAQLNHPNVVQVFDFGEADGVYYLVMEFIDGVNLRVLFRKATEQGTPLAFTLVARIISQACEGLAYAHDFVDPATNEPMGLVHRDVSPDNVLIARNGSVRVVDFGIAKAANQTNLTKTGTVKGKFSYMPPEQLTGQPLDRRADVFALGIVLYELLTGRKPFDTSNEAFIVRAIMYETFAPATQFRPDVPEAMQRILDKAMAKSRDERYADCRELQGDLERFILHQGEPVSQYQLSQLVQRVAPAAPFVAAPAPSAPQQPPIGVPPTSATVEEVNLSTALMATPPPQPSIISLVPKARPQNGPPPPPVPTQANALPHFSQAEHRAAAVPMLPPAQAPGEQRPLMSSPIDLGSVSPRNEQSAERPVPVAAKPRSLVIPLALLTIAVLSATIVTLLVLRATRAQDPVGVAVALPKPEPIKVEPEPVKPEPIAVVPKPEPVNVAPEPVKPEPIAVAPKPEPIAVAPKSAPEPLKTTLPKVAKVKTVAPIVSNAPKAPVEFRVRPFGAIWVDGAYLGETPFAPAALSLGAHSVRVVNRDLGKEVTKQFDVKDGSNVFRHNFEE